MHIFQPCELSAVARLIWGLGFTFRLVEAPTKIYREGLPSVITFQSAFVLHRAAVIFNDPAAACGENAFERRCTERRAKLSGCGAAGAGDLPEIGMSWLMYAILGAPHCTEPS